MNFGRERQSRDGLMETRLDRRRCWHAGCRTPPDPGLPPHLTDNVTGITLPRDTIGAAFGLYADEAHLSLLWSV